MAENDASVLARLRKPEYTGENRCTPCTIVNVAIAAAASVLVWVAAGPAGEIVAGGLAAAVLAGSLVTIYLWGYLVPGTPTLTKRYLPDRVLALFDKHPLDEHDEESWDAVEQREREQRDAVDPEEFLLSAAVVAPCDHEDDLCFADEFGRRLDEYTEQYRDEQPSVEDIEVLFDADPEAVTRQESEHPTFEVYNRLRSWPSEAALIADVAADRALRAHTDRWTEVPVGQRANILESLRSFRQTCPLCGGGVELGTDTVESCCRSYDVARARCIDCDETLLEFDPSMIEADDAGQPA
ncbi:hypothetical protein SAMN06269185_0083 [Natronoarchaeum philippinense]|uniref:Uncharacterized protein n=1 Tax=Natronoarchaeum philippinense TaxID=558529 RepID=A0A285MZQ1_NATPI|nr:hypothetical protein [Natronoarchaeum philippinense]SNZ02684.1 hypothetical protein SAMN06269185_0083 [Natronoarchaeum philippinense]